MINLALTALLNLIFSYVVDSVKSCCYVRSLYNDPNSSPSATLHNMKARLGLIGVAT